MFVPLFSCFELGIQYVIVLNCLLYVTTNKQNMLLGFDGVSPVTAADKCYTQLYWQSELGTNRVRRTEALDALFYMN